MDMKEFKLTWGDYEHIRVIVTTCKDSPTNKAYGVSLYTNTRISDEENIYKAKTFRIGLINNTEPFGEILFTKPYLNQYPHMRYIKVTRCDNGSRGGYYTFENRTIPQEPIGSNTKASTYRTSTQASNFTINTDNINSIGASDSDNTPSMSEITTMKPNHELPELKKRKVIAITGAAEGIGRSTLFKFLEEGWRVAFCDINEKACEALSDDIIAAGYEKKAFSQAIVDIKDRQNVRSWLERTNYTFGRIDALFANAGIHRSNTIFNITDDDLDMMIDTNIKGTVITIQEALSYLKASAGSIVINCSDQFFIGKSNNFGYGLTKGALGQITRSLAIELSPFRIRVNAVCPGTIRTPLSEAAIKRYADRLRISTSDAWAEEDRLFLTGRCGTPEEVAEVVYFLTEKATFTTGSHYRIDGGICSH